MNKINIKLIVFAFAMFISSNMCCGQDLVTTEIEKLINLKNQIDEEITNEIERTKSTLDSLENAKSEFNEYYNAKIDSLKRDQVNTNGIVATIRTDNVAHIYENKSSFSNSLASLKSGTQVTIIELTNKMYCKVDYNGVIGYLKIENIYDGTSLNSGSNIQNSSSTTNNSYYSSPNYKYKSSSYSKSSSQCTGYTKSGKRCKNSTKSYSGRCHLHD